MAEITRKTELSKRKSIKDDLLKVYEGIEKQFGEASTRINDALDYWDCYNCVLNENQFYNGNSQAYVPIIHDAVQARKTRFVNQVFPQSGRYVEVTTDSDELPDALIALIDHYVEKSKMRVSVIPALFTQGDIEGQWNVYVDWWEHSRFVTTRTRKGPEVEGVELDASVVSDDDMMDDVTEEKVLDFGPVVEILPDADVMVTPLIADSVDEALFKYAGSATILRRWSKGMIKAKIKAEEISQAQGDELIARLEAGGKDTNRKDMKKEHVDAAGVKSGGKYALVYETWKVLEVDGNRRLTRTYFGGDDLILSCRLNPFWCDLCPLISEPVDKIGGSFKGISKIDPVAKLQYLANDFLNQGADSASYSLLPIIMTNPLNNPRVGSMVIDLAAVWEVDPNSTKFAEFPPLWKDALGLVAALTQQVMQTLGVNPSMVAQRSAAKKPSQAEVASEQQVDILTTADVIVPFESGILTPIIRRFMLYDAQFRQDAIWVKAFGREGMKSGMQEVPPQQEGNRMTFHWYGIEQARTAQQMQMQIAGMNVLTKVPPQMMQGRTLDMVPLIERFVEATYGPHLGPKIFKPISDMIGMPPDEENSLLLNAIDLPVSAADDDREHLQVHQQAMQGASPQARQVIQAHMWKHQQQMAAKNQAHAAQMQGGGQPGQGGGPRPGAQPGQATGGQNPPGAIHRDQMPTAMPRKAG